MRNVYPKRDFNRRPPQTVFRWNNGLSTSSVVPYIASFLGLHFGSSQILSTEQHHCQSSHLRSIDASRHYILIFSSTSGIRTFSNNIDVLPGRCVDQSTDRLSFRIHIIVIISPCCFQIPEPSIEGYHLWYVDGMTGLRWFHV